MKSTNNKILLLTALMMTSLSAFALKDDTNKPINIVSDNQSLDMENSVDVYKRQKLPRRNEYSILAMLTF